MTVSRPPSWRLPPDAPARPPSQAQAEEAAKAGTCTPELAAAAAARAEHLRSTGGTQVTLPFGVTLLAAGWRDEWLWGVAASMHRASGLGCGVPGHSVPAPNGKA